MVRCIFRDHAFLIEGTDVGGIEGRDYRIRYRQGIFPVLIMAPHGGFIEPGTSELADITAGEDFWFYAFEGIMARDNYSKLHIPSTIFNEPRWWQIAHKVCLTVAIHGVRGTESDPLIIGGRHVELSESILDLLKRFGFNVKRCYGGPTGGMSAKNVVNRNIGKSGVQLEIPRGLRNILLQDVKVMSELAGLIRTSLFGWLGLKNVKEPRPQV